MRFSKASLRHPSPHIVAGEDNLANSRREWIQEPHWWLMIMYRHTTVAYVNAVSHHVNEGTMLLFPPGSRGEHAKVGPDSPHIYLHFQLFDHENDVVALPIRTDHDSATLEGLSAKVSSINQSFATMQAYLWNFLWSISCHRRVIEADTKLLDAENFIQKHLSSPLTVLDVCDAVSAPYRTLARAFQAEHGIGIKQYILQKRSREAVRLISETSLTFKQISAKVGITDPHQFNKLIRHSIGRSPRSIREQSLQIAGRRFRE